MKCPKCGYNSFDYLESCKKCGEDMAAHKTKFGLGSLFFARAQEAPGADMVLGEEEEGAPSEELTATVAPAGFGLDILEGEEAPAESSLGVPPGADRPPEASGVFQEGDPSDFEFAWKEGDALNEAGEDFGQGTEAVTFLEWEQGEAAGPEAGWEPFENEDSVSEDFAVREKPDSWNDDFNEPVEGGGVHSLELSAFPTDSELFSLEDSEEPAGAGQGAPGPSEANLAQLFLDSLDGLESAEAAPAFSEEEISFEETSPEASEAGAEDSAGSDAPWEGEEAAASEEFRSPPLAARVGAGGADLMILSVIFVLFLVTAEVALGPDPGGGLFPSAASLLAGAIPYFLVFFAVSFGYFTLFHFLIGQTPGKMLFRIRVVGEDGDGLLFSEAFLRSVGGLLSLLPAGLGYVAVALDRERRGWNDRLAGSRVIPVAGWESLNGMSEVGRGDEGEFNPYAGA